MRRTRYAVAALVLAFLLYPVAAWASNSNPLCALFPKYSLEWYVLLCNLTEDPNPPEG